MDARDEKIPSAVNHRLGKLEYTVEDMRERVATMEKNAAVMDARFVHIDMRLSQIETGVRWIIGLVLAAIFGALLNFIMSGGLLAV